MTETYKITVDPNMTGDKYRAWLEQWAAKNQSARGDLEKIADNLLGKTKTEQ